MGAYLEAGRQWIVLNGQCDVVAWSEQLHNGLLVRCVGDVRSVHLQDTVAHPQLSAFGGNSLVDDLIVRERHQS